MAGGRPSKLTPETVKHRETAKHRETFEAWYEASRDFRITSEKIGKSDDAVRNWARWFGWDARADERDAEVERRNAKAAIERKAQMVEDHRKAGELVRKRGVEYLAKNPIKDERTAIAAVGKGIEIERTAEGMPAWMVAMMGMTDDELAAYIAAATGTAPAGDSATIGEGAGADDHPAETTPDDGD